MNKKLVSILIPVYNAEKYLSACIESAIQQSYADIEIIIIDDGSTDNSLSIAKKFENDTVTIYTQLNKGASAARNLGLKHANGTYIQFLDADDLLHPDKIKHQIKVLNQSEDQLALCATVHFKTGENPYQKKVEEEWYSEGSADPADFLVKLYGGSLVGPIYGGAIQPNAWLTPAKLISKAGNWDETLSVDDDGEFFCRIILASTGIVYSKSAINYYRKFENGANLSAKNSYKANLSALNANISKAKNLLNHTKDPYAKLALSRYFWENAFNFYPFYPDLSKKAELLAKSHHQNFHYNPYLGLKHKLANIFGWKLVRKIDVLRYKHAQ